MRGMTWRVVGMVCATGLLGLEAAPAAGQVAPATIDCGYDECALRLEHMFFGTRLVRGIGDERVEGGVDRIFSGSPVALELAARSQRRHRTGGVFRLIGTVAVTVALLTTDWSGPRDDTDAVLLWGGAAFVVTGSIIESSGRDYLYQAIWEYNRSLRR